MANPAGSDFKEVGGGRRGEADAPADDRLEGLLPTPATHQFAGEASALIDHAAQPWFELVAVELCAGANIEDGRGPLVEALANHVEDGIGLAGLCSGGADNSAVEARYGCTSERDHRRGQVRVAWARQAGLGSIDAIGGCSCVR